MASSLFCMPFHLSHVIQDVLQIRALDLDHVYSFWSCTKVSYLSIVCCYDIGLILQPCHRMYEKTNSMALVSKRTIPTERPPFVGEVNANFSG
jgi:hypothetical protein